MCLKFLTDIKMDHSREILSDDDNIHLMNKSKRSCDEGPEAGTVGRAELMGTLGTSR